MRFFSILMVVFVGFLSFFLYRLHKNQSDMFFTLQNKITELGERPVSRDVEVVERVISADGHWSDLQVKVRNTVVQVFSQIAAFDLLQPYKTPSQGQATGSGFFINSEGEFITNAHVVDQARSVWIQIPSMGKHQIDVDVIGVCPDRDIALLKVRPEGVGLIRKTLGSIPFLELGDSDLVRRGEEVMTLGYPLGQQGIKSTVGVVSGRESHLIQIDAAINPGNSGGPSVNRQGKIIGINTLVAAGAQNVGYIVPVNELKIVLDDLHNVPLLKKPFLGVLFNNASESLTKYLGNPAPGGLYVVDVYKGSPLHKAGVQKGDMIYEINGHEVDIYGELLWNEEKISLIDYVCQLKLGQKINLVVYRKGVRKNVSFNFDLSELLPVRRLYPGYEKIDYEIVAGMVIQPLMLNHLALLVDQSPSLAKYTEMKYQMEPALIITHVFPDSQAQRSRSLFPGSIIKEINGKRIKEMHELRDALRLSLDTGKITIETMEGIFVVCPFEKVVKEDERLSKNYFFPLSDTMKSMVSYFDNLRPVEASNDAEQNALTV